MSTSTPTSHRTGVIAASAGFRAVQSTPLFDRSSGEPVGMLCTHFRNPHRPSDRELRLTDLYARQSADVIASGISEQRLRGSEARLQAAVDELRSLNETLEERVRARTAETEEANQKLRSEIAERVRAEQRLQELQSALFHASRLSAMGQMAGSLAHELNRPWAPPPILSMQRPAFSRAANTTRLDIASRMIEDAAGQMHRAGQTIRGCVISYPTARPRNEQRMS
jgi:C4-dicarboxylate-specific signal transduction histidine kinase